MNKCSLVDLEPTRELELYPAKKKTTVYNILIMIPIVQLFLHLIRYHPSLSLTVKAFQEVAKIIERLASSIAYLHDNGLLSSYLLIQLFNYKFILKIYFLTFIYKVDIISDICLINAANLAKISYIFEICMLQCAGIFSSFLF